MKVKPMRLEENLYNPEDIEGFHAEYILPSDPETRARVELKIRRDQLYFDDLYDPEVEYETRLSNKNKIIFTTKIPLAEYDLHTEEQKIGYHQFLIDQAEDND